MERHPLDDMIYVPRGPDDGSGELIVHVAKGRRPWDKFETSLMGKVWMMAQARRSVEEAVDRLASIVNAIECNEVSR